LNLSADSSNRIFFALQQIISKSVVSSEELKNQLGEKIPGVLAISARAIGKNVDQLQKMLENGEVMAEEFLPKLAAELAKTFQVDAKTHIDTAAASLARFDNAIDSLQRRFAEGPSCPVPPRRRLSPNTARQASCKALAASRPC
jgi:tape measure domain-containing protein